MLRSSLVLNIPLKWRRYCMETDYIVVEMMKHLYGEDWNKEFVEKVLDGGIERVLL